jgi:hypothetical protein
VRGGIEFRVSGSFFGLQSIAAMGIIQNALLPFVISLFAGHAGSFLAFEAGMMLRHRTYCLALQGRGTADAWGQDVGEKGNRVADYR